MAKFRFRAQVALDLRRKEDDEARRLLGEAARATRAAEQALDAADRALGETMAQAAQDAASCVDTTRALWYRNWIVLQRQAIERAQAIVAERRSAERAAAERALVTRRKLRSLEHLRERNWQAFLLAERRIEQKEMDVLAGLRYVARAGAPKGD
jgi:flagellar export protein FliJ